MSFSRKVPSNRIEPLAWLGKTNWITPTTNGYRRSEEEILGILNRSVQFGRDFYTHVRDIINLALVEQTPDGPTPVARTPYSDLFFISSKVLASGQKTIRLSQEWCEAFENTELTLQFQDYRQPFQTMVIELPANYAERKFVPGGGDYPEFVVVHHEENEHVLLFELVFRNSQMNTLASYRLYDAIESVLQRLVIAPLDDVGFDTTGTEGHLTPFLRIALNAIIAMTYGTEWQKLAATQNERQTEKNLKRRRRGNDKTTAAKARLRLGTLPEVFQFDQTIKAFEDQRHTADDALDQDGTPKSPHWRRGHWRHQAVGHGRTQRELRWIRPMLINAGRFKGDPKDTTTTYVA